jgi:hypothetical protein
MHYGHPGCCNNTHVLHASVFTEEALNPYNQQTLLGNVPARTSRKEKHSTHVRKMQEYAILLTTCFNTASYAQIVTFR